jgi:hypothetical protein
MVAKIPSSSGGDGCDTASRKTHIELNVTGVIITILKYIVGYF